MRRRKAIRGITIEEGSGNVYADIGARDADAMLMKAQLVAKIDELIKEKGLTQMEAGELLGLPQPKVSALLRGHFRGISERRLMNCLTRLGSDVQVVVKPAPRSRHHGKLSIVFV
ncbi:MAG: XRE family transcriptional regulator [Nitrospirae bacterium]|nr:XRE family transcriptional regulator [Nitrospirota bacterium]